MKLSIVSACSASFREVGKLTEPTKLAFGERWAIPCHFPDYPDLTDHGWGRIGMMQHYLPETDWLLFMGADTMLVNHTIDARCFIDENADLVVAFDDNGLQSDVLFLRNCPAVHAVLDTVQKRREEDFNKPWLSGTEQGCLVRTLADLPRYINKLPVEELQYSGVRIKQAPKSINRYLHDFQVGDWCFHACNMSMPDRIHYLSAFSKQIVM